MTRDEVVVLVEKIIQIKCPRYTKNQKGCYFDCPYSISTYDGETCVLDEFANVLNNGDDFTI